MLHAAAGLKLPPEHCMYVGDAERDIEAGRVTGMRTVLADYGYIADSDTPDSWGRIAHCPSDNYWTTCPRLRYSGVSEFVSDHHRGRHGFDGVAKRMRHTGISDVVKH